MRVIAVVNLRWCYLFCLQLPEVMKSGGIPRASHYKKYYSWCYQAGMLKGDLCMQIYIFFRPTEKCFAAWKLELEIMLLSFNNAGITLAFCKMLLLFIKSLTRELEENNRKIGTISGKKMKKGAFKVDFICFPSLAILNVLKLGSQWCSPISGLGWCPGWYTGLVTPSLR